MKKRARTERREAERQRAKLRRDGLRLAALERGGAPDRPIELTSASVIEPHAASMPCAACGGVVRVISHEAKSFEVASTPRRLRVVSVQCAACGVARDVFFDLTSGLAS